MASTFISGEQKVRAGVYFRTDKDGGVVVAGATNGKLACAFQSNWGPINKVVELDTSLRNNISDYYGDSRGTQVISEGFVGGAITVLACRVGEDDGTPSAVALCNEASEPVVLLQTAYPTDKEFAVSIRSSLVNNERQCVIYDGTSIFEQFGFEKSNNEPAALVDAINRSTKNFIASLASVGATGTMENVIQKKMTAGKNPTVTVSSYSKATDILERYKWNCIVVDTDDNAVKAIINSFVSQSYDNGHLGFGCYAGTHSENIESRIARAAAINDEKMVYLLHGWNDNDGVEHEGWLAAARIGGMVASFDCSTSLTHNVIRGAVELIEPLTNGELVNAQLRGCLTLSINDSGQVWLEKAINTLVTLAKNQDEGWKKIKRTKIRFEMIDRINTTCDNVVANVNNDENGRQTVMAAAMKVLKQMVAEKKLMNPVVYEDPEMTAEGDSAWFKVSADDIDSLEKIYLTFVYRFSSVS